MSLMIVFFPYLSDWCTLTGEQPAAMQRSDSALMMNTAGHWWRLLLVGAASCYSSYSVIGTFNLPLSVSLFVFLSAVPIIV